MGTFLKGDKGKDYLKISNYYLQFARFRMETEEDENINKPRQNKKLIILHNKPPVTTRWDRLSVVTVIGTLPSKPFVDNMNWFTMERNPTSVGIVISALIGHQPGINMK